MASLLLALRIFRFYQYVRWNRSLDHWRDLENAIAANSSFPGKSPSGNLCQRGRRGIPASRRFAHLNALLGTRRAPNVFRVLSHALVTAPFENVALAGTGT